MKKILAMTLLLGVLLLAAAPARAQSDMPARAEAGTTGTAQDVPAPAPKAASPFTAGFLLGVNAGKIEGLTSINSYRFGLTFGGFFNFALSRVFSFEPQIYFTQKGASYSTEITLGLVTTAINLSYIEIPLLFKITIPFGDDYITRPRLFGGPTLAYLTRGILKQRYEDYLGSDDTTLILSDMKRFETGWIAGVGVEFDVKGGLFSVDARYASSFGAISTTPPDKKNKVISIVLGFAFK